MRLLVRVNVRIYVRILVRTLAGIFVRILVRILLIVRNDDFFEDPRCCLDSVLPQASAVCVKSSRGSQQSFLFSVQNARSFSKTIVTCAALQKVDHISQGQGYSPIITYHGLKNKNSPFLS